ncbi:MAG: hypothetical protein GQ564_05925 [Bacteroidales bacterium]|nr:hypothetical protein [Bacteroidales bacterium]
MGLEIYQVDEYEDYLWEIDGMSDCYCQVYDKPKHAIIKKVEEILGANLFNEMRDFYSKCDGFTIQWYTQKPGAQSNVGSCMISSLQNYISGTPYDEPSLKDTYRYKNYLWDETDNEELIEYLERNIFIVDYVDLKANVFVVFDASKGEKLQLILYKYPHQQIPLSLSFREYVIWADKLRAMQGWQEIFIENANLETSLGRHYPFYFYFKETFPDLKVEQSGHVKDMPNSLFENLHKNDYLNKFYDSIQKLEEILLSHKTQAYFEIRDEPLTIHVIRKIELILGKPLSDEMLAFYCQINGFRLVWALPDNSKQKILNAKADFKILGLDEMFGGFEPLQNRNWNEPSFEGILTFPDSMDEDKLKEANNFRLFNAEELNDVAISFETEKPQLYVYEKGEYFKLSLSFTDYLKKLIENRGIEYWQKFFTYSTDYTDDYLQICPPVVSFIKTLFPNVKVKNYRQVKSNMA